MYQRSKKMLFPASLVVFAGLLLSLLGAAPPETLSEEDGENAGASETDLPWTPLSHPSEDLVAVSSVWSTSSAEQRLDELERLAENKSLSPLTRGLASFAAAISHSRKNNTRAAVKHFEAPEIEATALGAYALYYAAQELESSEPRRAAASLRELVSRHPDFALMDEARIRYAQLLHAQGEGEQAVLELKPVTFSADEKRRGEALDEISKILIDLKRYPDAVDALETLYYRIPRHERARNAGRRLTALRSKLPEPEPSHFYALSFRRADLLMQKGHYHDAYNAFASILTRFPKLADEDLVRLRMGICQYRRRQLTASIANFRRVKREELVPEALFYQAEVARRLRQEKSFRERTAEILSRFPTSPWAEAALFSLGRFYESEDQKDAALGYYQRLVNGFPRGQHYLDAKWRLLWHAYGAGRFEEAAFGLEEAAREHPGAPELSRFLYWAGRAYQQAGRSDRAEPLFRQVLLGYQNTYYGRRAFERLTEMKGQNVSLAAIQAARQGIDLGDALRVDRVDVQNRVAQLLAVGLSRLAIREAEAAVQGKRDDSAFLAMAAWIHADQNRNLDAIKTIGNAFPFHVSATGDLLPRPIWELFYPLHYWDQVEQHASARGLDPYLVAALIRQESTFNPRVQSRAGARGLMQIMPATGRLLARQEKRRYQLADLYNPEVNILYGTRYLKDVLGRFQGRIDYALAGYNAGPHRVTRWTGMDMSIDPEVFIEEIPFNETRNYVKLVLRNEMLYRRLYGATAAE